MSLPEKQYFSFQQIAKRWHVELQDMYDYAVEEIFVTLVWIGKTHVEFGYYDEAADGEGGPFWVPTKRCWHNGYGIVQPLDLREVLRSGGCPVQLFRVPGEKDAYLSIEDGQKDYMIEPRDLMISRAERDRVEQMYDPCACGCDAAVPGISKAHMPPHGSMSFPGRPSVMHRILQHMKERALAHSMCPALRQEADYLHGWAKKYITDVQVPKPRSIENAIRSEFNVLSDSVPFKARKTGTH